MHHTVVHTTLFGRFRNACPLLYGILLQHSGLANAVNGKLCCFIDKVMQTKKKNMYAVQN